MSIVYSTLCTPCVLLVQSTVVVVGVSLVRASLWCVKPYMKSGSARRTFIQSDWYMKSQLVPDGTALIVGVHSYRSSVALSRRHAIRGLLLARQQMPVQAVLRFVLSDSTPDVDAGAADVWTFAVNQSSRAIGTYLLNNAFFRHAVALHPRIPFIARADDDSYFELSTVLSELRAVGRRDLIYGDFKEWYMWSPRSMQAACFDFSYARHALALRRLREVRDASTLPRFHRECLHADLVGPHPFAKGPLVALSHSVASRLVTLPEYDADEAFATSERRRVTLRSVVTGALYEPKHSKHPSRTPLFDDIYFGYLAMRAFANRSLALVNAPLSEFDKSRPLRLDGQRGFVRIYHKLKTAERFGWVNRSRELRHALRDKVRTRFVCTRTWKGLDRWHVHGLQLTSTTAAAVPGALERHDGGLHLGSDPYSNLTACCRGWIFCQGETEPHVHGRVGTRTEVVSAIKELGEAVSRRSNGVGGAK